LGNFFETVLVALQEILIDISSKVEQQVGRLNFDSVELAEVYGKQRIGLIEARPLDYRLMGQVLALRKLFIEECSWLADMMVPFLFLDLVAGDDPRLVHCVDSA